MSLNFIRVALMVRGRGGRTGIGEVLDGSHIRISRSTRGLKFQNLKNEIFYNRLK
jgi:hypothetical protein